MTTSPLNRATRPAAETFGHLRMVSVTTWLIAINVAIFIIDEFLARANLAFYIERLPNGTVDIWTPISGLGYFSIATGFGQFELWRLVTFQFLHAGVTHLLFNMLSLFFFGPLVEAYLGPRRFIAFYLISGIGGPLSYVLMWALNLLIVSPWTPLVGASAGIFGILMAAARIAPDDDVYVFGLIPIPMRRVAWLLIFIAAYTVIFFGASQTHNAGGEAAHLGGAVVGWLLIRNPQWLEMPRIPWLGQRRRPF